MSPDAEERPGPILRIGANVFAAAILQATAIIADRWRRREERKYGGAGGIRTLDRALQPYNGLANRRLQPLGHSSIGADMPDTEASRKPQIVGRL